jgi:hypothetical protein
MVLSLTIKAEKKLSVHTGLYENLNSRRIITMPGQGREYRASGRLIRSRKCSDEEGDFAHELT